MPRDEAVDIGLIPSDLPLPLAWPLSLSLVWLAPLPGVGSAEAFRPVYGPGIGPEPFLLVTGGRE